MKLIGLLAVTLVFLGSTAYAFEPPTSGLPDDTIGGGTRVQP